MSTAPPIVFLDLDGTVVDWHTPTAALFDVHDIHTAPWGDKGYWMHDRLGITEEEQWDVLNDLGIDFWSDLQPYPHYRELYDGLRNAGVDLYFLSSPSLSPAACAGKMLWLERWAPKFGPGRLILTQHKHLLAGHGRTLIDDCEEHIGKFYAGGGTGILFPAPWNRYGKNYSQSFVNDYVARIILQCDPRYNGSQS